MHADNERAQAFRASYRCAQKCAKRDRLSKWRKSNSRNKSREEHVPKSSDSDTKFRGLLREPRRIGGEVVAGSRCDDDDNFYIQESFEGYEEDEEDTRALPLL